MPKPPTLDADRALRLVEQLYTSSIVPMLVEYIKIPNKSPGFAPDWEQSGHMRRAMDLIVAWCRARRIAGMRLEVLQLPGRTPLLFIEVPGAVDGTVLLYGHMDKQPEMTGWADGLGPWQPVLRGDRLYGRGGADDGYSTFASLAALEVLQDQNVPHARCVVIIEGCEESGSGDLPAYIEHLRERIGTPSLVVCLDSGAADYERLWCTTSLRGMVIGNLHVDVLREGVHSGEATGIVPSSFRIARAAARPARRRADGARASGMALRANPRAARRAGARDGRRARRRDREPLPVARRHAAGDRRAGRADLEPHLAPAARDHRCRRPAGARLCGQRSALGHRAARELALAARRRGRDREGAARRAC